MSPFQSWILDTKATMSVTGTHIGPALTETENLKVVNFEAKNSFNLKLFFGFSYWKKETSDLKPEPRNGFRKSAKAAAKIGYQATCWHLLHRYQHHTRPNPFLPVAFLITSSSHHLAFQHFFAALQRMAGHMNLTTKWYQLQRGTRRVLRLVRKITLRLWIQNLNQT